MARSSGRGKPGGSGRRSRSRAARPQTNRHYPRTARLNTLLQEIVADFMERVDDDRLGLVTVTGVEVDNDLNRAEVFVSSLDSTGAGATPEADEALLDALADHRKAVQGEIAREARIRKTPEVAFAIDPAVRSGARIEEILSSLATGEDGDDAHADDSDEAGDGAADGEPAGDDTGA